MRLFVAISLPEFVKDALERFQTEVRGTMPAANVRWTRRDQFHLTLKFLGAVEPLQGAQIATALESACAAFIRFRLWASGVGFFPNVRRPRVIWAGVRDRENTLLPLQKAVDAAMAPFNAQEPETHFSAHVTLGRIKEIARRDLATLSKLIPVAERATFGDWQVNEVHLVQSELSAVGSHYRILTSALLAGAGSKLDS